jgi:hypothetical protein
LKTSKLQVGVLSSPGEVKHNTDHQHCSSVIQDTILYVDAFGKTLMQVNDEHAIDNNDQQFLLPT